MQNRLLGTYSIALINIECRWPISSLLAYCGRLLWDLPNRAGSPHVSCLGLQLCAMIAARHNLISQAKGMGFLSSLSLLQPGLSLSLKSLPLQQWSCSLKCRSSSPRSCPTSREKICIFTKIPCASMHIKIRSHWCARHIQDFAPCQSLSLLGLATSWSLPVDS